MTAFTSPVTWSAGGTVGASTLNTNLRDNMLHMTEVQAWTPTVTQSGSVSRTVSYGRYWMTGKRVHCVCRIAVTGAGTTNNQVTLSLPVTADTTAAATALVCVGNGYINDSGTQYYTAAVLLGSTTTVYFRADAQGGGWGITPNVALANGDEISCSIDYEAA